ncbi:hypothetical protein DRJ19_04500 [Candidatus Woesearchaeota archaeon]|nr:MAG: hypothetical protein DRJ19_04500 [Candidatus Woesearchaeota archaeon]
MFSFRRLFSPDVDSRIVRIRARQYVQRNPQSLAFFRQLVWHCQIWKVKRKTLEFQSFIDRLWFIYNSLGFPHKGTKVKRADFGLFMAYLWGDEDVFKEILLLYRRAMNRPPPVTTLYTNPIGKDEENVVREYYLSNLITDISRTIPLDIDKYLYSEEDEDRIILESEKKYDYFYLSWEDGMKVFQYLKLMTVFVKKNLHGILLDFIINEMLLKKMIPYFIPPVMKLWYVDLSYEKFQYLLGRVMDLASSSGWTFEAPDVNEVLYIIYGRYCSICETVFNTIGWSSFMRYLLSRASKSSFRFRFIELEDYEAMRLPIVGLSTPILIYYNDVEGRLIIWSSDPGNDESRVFRRRLYENFVKIRKEGDEVIKEENPTGWKKVVLALFGEYAIKPGKEKEKGWTKEDLYARIETMILSRVSGGREIEMSKIVKEITKTFKISLTRAYAMVREIVDKNPSLVTVPRGATTVIMLRETFEKERKEKEAEATPVQKAPQESSE